jgi:predicted DCC family thiol-disulfide oxidoreductase YuxK
MKAGYDIEVFFDGQCPICLREIKLLRRWDTESHIRFTDIAGSEFDARSVGVAWSTLMASIHGRLADGTLVEGVEVFRRLYAAVGFSKLVALSRLPGISAAADLGYHIFAKNRLRLSGRCTDQGCSVGGIKESEQLT